MYVKWKWAGQLLSVFAILHLAPLLTSSKELIQPLDCNDIHQQDSSRPSGVYTIYPFGEKSAVEVYCDMDLEGGGWTVFHKRMDGSLNFYRPWNHYKMGFGNPDGEYWLGLDIVSALTSQQKSELRVDMRDFLGKEVFARYSSFKVDAECDGYKLTIAGFTNGGAGDGLTYHNGIKFSTFDKDQDGSSSSCAQLYLGAFWYNNCHHANPNGVYRWGAMSTYGASGMEWYHWKGWGYSLKAMSMKFRPVQ
ncbi:microfibril-associated glycoprotein 4 [Haplochromis burtoni]|uniref:Microfibril associated protein 4 n=1 Tax=Haplochromis burtoni TaxID=8153 RepID=A0A3Q2WVB9_HAPBU|nr:microfibril-associated glycoprotein 4 [Haplochromis burtoni]